jgi:hypothetical protein
MRGPILRFVQLLTCVPALALMLASGSLAQTDSGSPIRVGTIELDTSHCVEFTKIFNDPSNPLRPQPPLSRPLSSPDIKASQNRVEGFTTGLRDKR